MSVLMWSLSPFPGKHRREGQASPAPPLSFPSWNSRLSFLVHTPTTSYSFLCTLVSLFLRGQEWSQCGGQLRESVCTELSVF